MGVSQEWREEEEEDHELSGWMWIWEIERKERVARGFYRRCLQ
jgi:hypothetical protein